MKDLGEHCTVTLGLGGPGATMGGSADHVLVGVVVHTPDRDLANFSVLGLSQFSNGRHSSTSRDR